MTVMQALTGLARGPNQDIGQRVSGCDRSLGGGTLRPVAILAAARTEEEQVTWADIALGAIFLDDQDLSPEPVGGGVASDDGGVMQVGFRTVDGVRVRCAENTGPSAPSILLTSPWPESVYAFAPIWPSFANVARLVAVDLPGFGRSERRDGIEPMLGMHATAARREGDEYVLAFDGGTDLRGDRLLVATGRRPRTGGIGLETVGVEAGPHGIPVDEHMRAGERLWAIGDVTGIWPLTHVGEYEGDVVAANIAGDAHPANYEAVPRVTYTDPQAAAVGAAEAEYSATALVSELPKTATYTHAYAESNGFLTLLSDGERLTGGYALGPEAGEWMQQATLAIRAHVPVDVLTDVIQPFPSFSGIYATAVKVLRMQIADMPRPAQTDGRADGEPVEVRRTERDCYSYAPPATR
jgi:hypothetical protein